MSKIFLKTPIPHPTQKDVFFTQYALEELHLLNGSAIDSPAVLQVVLRPCVPIVVDGAAAYLSAPNVETFSMEIPDVYRWLQERADVGDMVPLSAMGFLMAAAAGEYSRR